MKNSSTTTRRHGAISTKSSLALAVVAALLGSATLGASATPAGALATVAHPTVLSRGDAIMGALPANQPMHVVIALKLRNKDVLDAFVATTMKNQAKGVQTPAMTSEQVLANHAPTAQQAQTVANYLNNMGFTNVRIAENRLLVTADGTAATAARAFLTSFRQVRTHDGRIAFANSADVRIPASLQGMVQSVLGLQNVHQLHTFATSPKKLPAQAQAAAATRTAGSVHPMFTNYYFPEEFSTVYGANSSAPSSNVIVGIISEGDVSTTISDLGHYTSGIGFPTVTTNILSTTGTVPASSDTSGQVEWNLDSQSIVGSAGGQVRQLNFYTMPDMTNGSLVADFNIAVTGNKAKIINVSLGECELGAQGGGGADAANAIFEVGIAQGQTFSVSTGDSGADECSDGGVKPSWPANSQYVVAVAGTNLVAGSPGRANAKAWASETEWTDSGGSESTYEPKPSWQTLWSGTHRGVADVAFDADPNTGAAIYIGAPAGAGGYYLVGGTSLSAPIFSGLWSRVLQQLPRVGFAGPVIYNLNSADFHDITAGDNGGGNIAVGYDLESGRGSMIFSSVISDIVTNNLGNQPPVATFSYVANGLSVNFNDTSTDVDGNSTIVSHYWTFGDGSTSTATNPTHAYTAVGTYLVKDKVTDAVGNVGSKSKNVTVTPYQLIANSGFEAGAPGHWSMTSGALQNNGSLAHAGSWFASMGGSVSRNDHVNQIVTIPSGLSSATLSFYLNTFTAETGASANDNLNVQVYVGGVLDSTLATYSNLDATSGYVVHNLDMSAYIGQTVTLKFLGSNNASLPTTWYLDDVTLMAQ